MGQIIGKVQQQCCATYYYNKLKQVDDNSNDPNRQMKIIQEDYKYFFQEQWFAKQENILFSAEKFIYIYYGYRADQIEMNRYWSQVNLHDEIKHGIIEREGDEVLQIKWKYLLRRGVPMDKMKSLILDIFKKTYENNNLEYENTQKLVFKGQKPPVSFKHIPIFNDVNLKIEEVLGVSVLTETGIQELGKICWTLHQTFHQIEYNPMVLQVANLMLIFISPSETFSILHFMLEDSYQLLNEKNQINGEQQRSLRWHFMMNKNEFERLGKSFYDTIQQKSQTFRNILAHFKKIGFNYNELFADMTNNIFLGYLHFSTVLKFFIMFLNEGIKIYLRMSYALCFILKEEILGNTDPSCMANMIKHLALELNQKQVSALIQKGFSLRLVRVNKKLSRYSVRNDKSTDRSTKAFYLPILKTPSEIIQSRNLESIWEYLPGYLKLVEPTLIFSSTNNGFSLGQLYQKTEYYQEYPALFFIKTSKKDVFGFFVDQNLKPTSQMQYYGTDENFVFKLHPEEKFYPSTGNNDCHLYSEKQYFSLGSSSCEYNKNGGVAIHIDSELNKGYTQFCETYESTPLTSNETKDFQITDIEVYAFIQDIFL